MAGKLGVKLTLSPENQFAMSCPVFNANTKIASCFALYDLHMRGEKQPTRKGCQVAMTAGKCPINVILKDMLRKGDDPYASVTAKTGTLRPEVLDRIAPVLILERHIERAGLSDGEVAALTRANEDARKGVRTITKTKRKPDPTPEQMPTLPPSTLKVTSETTEAVVTAAAISGDFAAAVNEGMKTS